MIDTAWPGLRWVGRSFWIGRWRLLHRVGSAPFALEQGLPRGQQHRASPITRKGNLVQGPTGPPRDSHQSGEACSKGKSQVLEGVARRNKKWQRAQSHLGARPWPPKPPDPSRKAGPCLPKKIVNALPPVAPAVLVQQLTPDEVGLLEHLWVAETQLSALPFSDRGMAWDDYSMAQCWVRREPARSPYGYATVEAPKPYASNDTHYGPTPDARVQRAGAVLSWWMQRGVLVAADRVGPDPPIPPAAVVATFARLLACADGMVLGSNGRPTSASQRTDCVVCRLPPTWWPPHCSSC